MQPLPALLFKSLHYTKEAETEEDLFKLLVLKPPDLIKFLVKACDDETWAETHPKFMRQALEWVTQEFYQDRLLMSFVRRLALVLREHYSAMQQFLPENLTVKLKDKDVKISGILFGSSSEYLREMLRRECRDMNLSYIVLDEIPYTQFEIIEAFVNTGSTQDLVRKDKPVVIKILKIALKWDLDELSIACQDYLKKYITADNVFETLIRSHLKQRLHLREACFEVANKLPLGGFRLESRGPEYLGFEFLDFTEISLAAFDKLKEHITHLICSGKLTEDATFTKVMKECSKLICLDISRSKTFSDQLEEIPEIVSELEVSDCPWINNENLGRLLDLCPQINSLTLVSDVDIGAEGWGALQSIEHLHNLNLTRCTQITDDDLSVILQACKGLLSLQVEECRRLTDAGFMTIPKYIPGLTTLNLARTWISTLPLIEIASNCRLLSKIDLTHCEYINEPALTELLRNGHELREVNVSHCDIPKSAIVNLRKRFPFAKIII